MWISSHFPLAADFLYHIQGMELEKDFWTFASCRDKLMFIKVLVCILLIPRLLEVGHIRVLFSALDRAFRNVFAWVPLLGVNVRTFLRIFEYDLTLFLIWVLLVKSCRDLAKLYWLMTGGGEFEFDWIVVRSLCGGFAGLIGCAVVLVAWIRAVSWLQVSSLVAFRLFRFFILEFGG